MVEVLKIKDWLVVYSGKQFVFSMNGDIAIRIKDGKGFVVGEKVWFENEFMDGFICCYIVSFSSNCVDVIVHYDGGNDTIRAIKIEINKLVVLTKYYGSSQLSNLPG
jgi:hypothetical protein